MPLPRDRAGKTYLIVTSEKGLAKSLDRAGIKGVIGCLKEIADAVRKRGIDTLLYVPDSKELSGDLPFVDAPLTPAKLSDAIHSIEEKTYSRAAFTYVLIVGNGDVIPFWRLENPAADSDRNFPTDAPYGVTERGEDIDTLLVADRAVGRIPLISCLENLLKRTGAGASGKPFGLSAAVWRDQAERVFGLIADAPLVTSPPLDLDSFKSGWLARDSILYFNVHGSQEERYWYGQDGLSYPRVLSPEIVARSEPEAALVLAEACYGGLVEGKRPQDSIALQFLSKGVAAFIGSSAVAYGSPDERLTEADLFAYLFLKRVLAGESCGDAFRESKTDFAAEMLRRQGYLDGDDKKTLVEFNLYGDPSLILAHRGGGRGREEMISDEIVDSIKQIVASRFPEMAGVEPDLGVETTALDGALAKKVRSRRPLSEEKAKGQVIERRVFIASFKRLVTAGDRRVERVVRITFDERGEVLKIVTSK